MTYNIKTIGYNLNSKTELLHRHKICANCFVEFCTILKTGGRSTKDKKFYCSQECISIISVQIRRKNGTYNNNSKEQIEKSFQTKLRKNPFYGKKSIIEMEKRNKRGLSNFDKNLYSHWTQDPKNKEYLSNLFKGRTFSEETRKKMSIARRLLLKNNPSLIYSCCNGGFRDDLNCYFRSNWEANYARILNYLDIAWQYEYISFELENGKSYTPDFKLSDKKFVEIKGFYDDDSLEKIDGFRLKFPDIELEIIHINEYNILRNLFKNKVKWEGK